MSGQPLVIYVPGMRPKPEPAAHRQALLQCFLAGIRRINPRVADNIETGEDAFRVIAWTYDFYGVHRDIGLDRSSIDAVVEQPKASAEDIVEATTLKRRLLRTLYRAADYLPFLIPHFANEKMELHLQDLRRYVSNKADIAEHTRQLFKAPLTEATQSGRPVLVLAHSMGSVIAYDSLWQLSRMSADEVPVELLVTMGSPLGQKYLQKRLLGSSIKGARRYPDNIRRWVNIAARGELTAIEAELRNDYAAMMQHGLVADIEDVEVYNYYRENGHLNIHAEYGYLVSEATAAAVSDWWAGYCE